MRPSVSGYGLGVSFDKNRKKYRSRIYHRGRIELGRFDSALEASLAYDQAVRLLGDRGRNHTNHPFGKYMVTSATVEEKVTLHLAKLDAAGGGSDDKQGAGDDQAGPGGDAAALGDALHDADDDAVTAFLDSLEADADAAADALWPADDSMGLSQPGFSSSTAGAVPAAAFAAQGAPSAGPQAVYPPLQPQAGFAGAAPNRHLPNQQPAAPVHSSAPGAGCSSFTGFGPGAAGFEGAGELLEELLAQLVPQAAAAAVWAAAPPAAAQQQQWQPGAHFGAPLQQQQQLLQLQLASNSDHSSAGSDLSCSSSPLAAGHSPPAFAAQQAARMADSAYSFPTSSFRPQAPMALGGPQQLRPALLAAADFMCCMDSTVGCLMELYARLTAQPLQHAGLAAVAWLAGVRAQSALLYGSGGTAPPSVCITMHVCAALMSAAATPPSDAACGPFNCSFLLVVLELLSRSLLSLREMCAGIHPKYYLSGEAMQAWREGLRAQAHSKAGQAVAAMLSFL